MLRPLTVTIVIYLLTAKRPYTRLEFDPSGTRNGAAPAGLWHLPTGYGNPFGEGNGRKCDQEGYSFSLAQINWPLPQMLNPSYMKHRPLSLDLLLYSRPRGSVSHLSE